MFTRFRPLLLVALACLALARPAAAGAVPTVLATGLGQVNHITVDDTHVYWTEVTRTHALIRKMPKGGGAITDLASEQVLHQGQVASYIHLRQLGDRLFWTRLSQGFVTRWTLHAVDKSGGPVQEVVAELTSQTPLLAGAWRVAGDEVLVALNDPDKLGLPDSTRIAGYHPGTDTWRAVLSGQLRRGAAYIIAADEDNAWVRGITNNDETEIGHVTLNTKLPVYTELLHLDEDDREAPEPGVTDGEQLYYWSRVFKSGLRKLPLAGGADAQVVKGTGDGLILTEGFFYWNKGKQILKRAVDGTTTIKHFKGAFATTSIGGLAADDDFLYLAQKKGGFSLIRIDK